MNLKLLAIGVCAIAIDGCIDANIDASEDNDVYTCESTGAACDPTFDDVPKPRDKCDATGITNLLVGTCWWEQCRDKEKSLYPKIAGTPCIYRPKTTTSTWAEGACSDDGVCLGTTP